MPHDAILNRNNGDFFRQESVTRIPEPLYIYDKVHDVDTEYAPEPERLTCTSASIGGLFRDPSPLSVSTGLFSSDPKVGYNLSV